METGVIIAHHRAWRVEVAARIKAIESELDNMVRKWHPRDVAFGKPPPLQLPQQQQGIDMLSRALELWAQGHYLPLYCYPIREMKVAILGRPTAAKEELAYAAMTRWGLLGEGKTTHEWTAIAVGDYHLGLKKTAAGIEI